MRVSQISVCNNVSNLSNLSNLKCNVKTNRYCGTLNLPPKDGIEFKGKFGALVGGILGTASVATVAVAAAPVAVCFLAAGAIFGAIGGDSAEDAVNKNDNSTKPD